MVTSASYPRPGGRASSRALSSWQHRFTISVENIAWCTENSEDVTDNHQLKRRGGDIAENDRHCRPGYDHQGGRPSLATEEGRRSSPSSFSTTSLRRRFNYQSHFITYSPPWLRMKPPGVLFRPLDLDQQRGSDIFGINHLVILRFADIWAS